MMTKSLNVLTFICFFILLSCDTTSQPHKAPPQSALWSEYIAAHSSGLVAKKSQIRVRFIHAVVDEAGPAGKGLIRLDPDVKGDIQFIGQRELVFIPDAPLQSGQHYSVTVDTGKLHGFPENLTQYQFQLNVFPQNLQIRMDDFLLDPGNRQKGSIRGTLTTSDQADDKDIEKILSARYQDHTRLPVWHHQGNVHTFILKDIQREKAQQFLKLQWDGGVIGVKNKGERVIAITALDEFKIVHAKILQDKQQFVELLFSENLDRSQNMDGLIDADFGNYTLGVEANRVKIYPATRVIGHYQIHVEGSVRSEYGARLGQRRQFDVEFKNLAPQVRLVGKGTILPENSFLSIPFESVNVHAVQVTAFEVYEKNIGQFLQSNKIDGDKELGRVGRFLWRKTIQLGEVQTDQWTRHYLDATALLKKHPGSLFRLTVSINRGNTVLACENAASPPAPEPPFKNHEDLLVQETSAWNFAEYAYGQMDDDNWQDKEDPCKDGYYRHSPNVSSTRNFIASNIGLIAKRGSRGRMHVVATDIRTAKPMAATAIEFFNFQNQSIGQVRTNKQGFASLVLPGKAFYLVARKAKQVGYLKTSDGSALPISHFDVGGEKISNGIKGYIYAERGVWRPGDDIYLTFVLMDNNHAIPDNHPVTMNLFNPKGQLIQSQVNSKPVGDFYAFKLATPADAITGTWTARALLGGSEFGKKIKIETVIPNRLKIDLAFDQPSVHLSEQAVSGNLSAKWLHGGSAAGLNAEIEAALQPVATHFDRYADFNFDDPVRAFHGDSFTLFKGTLNEQGTAAFSQQQWRVDETPGKLKARFVSRVYEQGGAFSIGVSQMDFYAYKNYLGIKLPKGDRTRGMLLTDTEHTVNIASLDSHGKPVSMEKIQVKLFKISWKWWWDKSGESLARFANASNTHMLTQATIATHDGHGEWTFRVNYPDWGRYLVRACDLSGGHCTGQIVYIDWPGWAGRAQEENGPGAAMLNFFADKKNYTVGETAMIQLPPSAQGRALLSIENGSRVITQRWVFAGTHKKADGGSRFPLPITAAMAPNVYVSVMMIQPHQNKHNDRPIRMYGVIPITVTNPKTLLTPVLKAADEWEPASTVAIEVSEKTGHAMQYTVAVVDEGLLGLTQFHTPNPHKHFYRRESLGVTTWDLFDGVVGAYGGELERLLALGGDADGGEAGKHDKKKRFPPVVRFVGPFQLDAGAHNSHRISLPQYVGAVRVMVVAGMDGAYGNAHKMVYVRKPLMLLPTVPRVMGPDETLTLPVSVFTTDPAIKEVELSLQSDGRVELLDHQSATISFTKPGEQIGFVRVKVKPQIGKARLHFTAQSGKFRSHADISVDIISPNAPSSRRQSRNLAPGESWKTMLKPHGMQGTNHAKVEVSAGLPMNLNDRLSYLIRYPHGCLEQTTSAIFPQLYLPKILSLSKQKNLEIEKNMHTALTKLRQFQTGQGSFMYWPGSGNINDWAGTYVGHFLVEAKLAGYQLPSGMLGQWVRYQKRLSQSWVSGSGRTTAMQAYRLYALSLAGAPQLSAMNRLKESRNLEPVSRWLLAAAYQLAGVIDAAESLMRESSMEQSALALPSTFSSPLRNQAILLNTLVLMHKTAQAKGVAAQISKQLAADNWYNTHAVAFALLAMAKYLSTQTDGQALALAIQAGKGNTVHKSSAHPVMQFDWNKLAVDGEQLVFTNQSAKDVNISVVLRGVPAAGDDIDQAEGLQLTVDYHGLENNDPGRIAQSRNFDALVTVSNTTGFDVNNIALTHIVASGWEIHNPNLGAANDENAGLDYRDIRDDRVLSYFGLKANESKTFTVHLNAAYLGRYYLPGVSVEAMYDHAIHAAVKGRWVEVIR